MHVRHPEPIIGLLRFRLRSFLTRIHHHRANRICRAAAEGEDAPFVGQEHFNQRAHHAGRGIKLAAVLAFVTGELQGLALLFLPCLAIAHSCLVQVVDRADHRTAGRRGGKGQMSLT